MDNSDEQWELSPEVAHPNARRLMKAEYFWDVCDEDSPFGNDTGADTLEFFREHLESQGDDEQFLSDILEEWEVDRETAESVSDDELKKALEDEHFHVLTYDDVGSPWRLLSSSFGASPRSRWPMPRSAPSSDRPSRT